MPKYLLLKNYTGGPQRHPDYSQFDDWTSDAFAAHMAFQNQVFEMLRERGELVDHKALAREGTYVRYDGPGKAPMTDGPFPETKELVAGWCIVDVESEARAHEIAAQISSAPGANGKPSHEWIEVRPIMGDGSETEE